VLETVVNMVRDTTPPGGPKFQLDIQRAEPEDYFVVGHDIRLGQVFNNLIDNARSFCRKDGTVRVRLKPMKAGGVEVSVEDEGVGIPHAEQERIFRKFYRGDATATGAVGAGATGLGLFLAEGLVTAMGGRIRVDSSEGKGSTFVLELRASESET
jgi:two-component system sensor histidine kinase ChvG